jgi:hypothetical protein
MESRAHTVLPGRSRHFGIPPTPILFRFGARAIRGAALERLERPSPQSHTSE